MFWRTYKPYSSSGQNDLARWGLISHGDAFVDYLFALLKNNDLVMEPANPEVGPAGVEGGNPLETGAGTCSMRTRRGKRKPDSSVTALESLVQSSASMAAFSAKHTQCAEVVSLSATLKNLRECGAAAELIRAVEKQLQDAILSRPSTDGSSDPGAPRVHSGPEGMDRSGGGGSTMNLEDASVGESGSPSGFVRRTEWSDDEIVGGSASALLWILSSDLRATQCGAPSKPQPTT